MSPRAVWKGYLKVDELTCEVGLYTAVSSSERIAFHTLNRATGHRVHRQYIDGETKKVVDKEDQVKGYEVAQNEYVVLEPAEVATAVPDSDKTLAVHSFIGCNEIDDTYFDRPYYLAAGNPAAREAFAVIRESMRAKKVAALARTVLFRRVRTVLLRAHEDGLIATTLNFDYEVRSAEEAFKDIKTIKIEGEMLDLAKHIISTKKGRFDPRTFEDRYEQALADLVSAKLAGRTIKRPAAPRAKVIDLMEALRQSAGAEKPVRSKTTAGKKGTKSGTAEKPAADKTRRRKAS
jgi:DNA end-binding protein Ku